MHVSGSDNDGAQHDVDASEIPLTAGAVLAKLKA